MASSIFSTVVAGVSVFVIGQIILKWFLDPIIAFKEQLGRTSSLFLSKQAAITNVTYSEELVNELKECAASLMAKKSAISFYQFFQKFLMLPPVDNIYDAALSINEIASIIASQNKIMNHMAEENVNLIYPIKIKKALENIQGNLFIITSYGLK
ncbi:hypothetical protein FXN80_10780 [Dickeya fangzhongdai]|uniref:hypothetical protein n=1 Tax=Dickeya fangzhongdai TaxID=1778540 RepID=UPI00136F4548|nr:hypothetical protein [Dickeya fangzhongdai]UMB78848.1 hypothetical protein FXN80_10780 [Dickeya fangzhongdai]